MKAVIGLGNPGDKYKNTRHNLGFAVVEEIRKSLGLDWDNVSKLQAFVSKKDDLILAKPDTFMNSSGIAVQKITAFYKVESADLIIVHDDLDMDFGTHKMQLAKGPKDHNGILSIEKALGTKDFWRMRIGVGRNESTQNVAGEDLVLMPMTDSEISRLQPVISAAASQILKICTT